jgi:hypothetical protein
MTIEAELRQSPHGEWVRDGVGILVRATAGQWYAYPFGEAIGLGPFPTALAALRALEHAGSPAQAQPRSHSGSA